MLIELYKFRRVESIEAIAKIEEQRMAAGVKELKNLEEQAISLVGTDIYEKIIKGYTLKQWGRPCTELLDMDNYQGNAVVNYTDSETPYTRIIEHKWFEFGNQAKTVISKEYSTEWCKGDEPYYPVNDEKNMALYQKYKELADKEEKVVFGGHLGEYKYYDMDAVIESALVMARELLDGSQKPQ